MNDTAETLAWSVESDLSGVVHMGKYGGFKTELEAVHRLIEYLEGEREDIARKIAEAKRRRRYLQSKEGGAS